MVQITSKDKKDALSLPVKTTDYADNKELPLKSFIRLHKIFLLNESLILSKATSLKPSFLEKVIEKIIGKIGQIDHLKPEQNDHPLAGLN
jgi:mRNA interferase MazF